MGGDFKFDAAFIPGMGGTGDGEEDNKYAEMDDKLAKEQEAIEAKLEKQRAHIMANKQLDDRRKNEMMEKVKQKAEEEDKIRANKQRMMQELKEKENKIMIGQKKK